MREIPILRLNMEPKNGKMGPGPNMQQMNQAHTLYNKENGGFLHIAI